ncbi:MAG: PASTA domain-containing protein [Bacteroidales bacterium]|nr:PASTA domain-containing protein [Bacteroidales bacterium]
MKIKSFFQKYPTVAILTKVILISFVIVIVVILSLRFFTNHGKEYLVPDFKNLTLTELEDFEKNKNKHKFKLIINDSVFMPDMAGGTVISQDPETEMKVKKGRKIYLSISMMVPPQVEMPNLVDLSLRQAVNMLESNDLKLGQVIYQPSKYPNVVLEQRYKGNLIKEGKKIPYHSSITLIVGKKAGEDSYIENIEFVQ